MIHQVVGTLIRGPLEHNNITGNVVVQVHKIRLVGGGGAGIHGHRVREGEGHREHQLLGVALETEAV